MESTIISSLAFLFMGFALAYISLAQNNPQDYLNAHNAARAQVGVKPLTRSNSLAAYARQYARKRIPDCKLEHSTCPYSENIAEASYAITGSKAVELWIDEKPNHNYQLNKCVGGQCGHYTQVVWRNSAQVGCARVKCNNGWWFVTCNYNPPGNIVGERPY